MSATQLVAAGSLAELESEGWLLVRLAPDMSGRPREAVVVRGDDGIARAYLNQCRHLPIPLDGGSRQFLIAGQLHCGTHGARYRLNDGLCVLGPCRGASLFALPVEIIDARVFVRDELSR